MEMRTRAVAKKMAATNRQRRRNRRQARQPKQTRGTSRRGSVTELVASTLRQLVRVYKNESATVRRTRVRVYECASVRVCECASVRVCECASVRVCECASVRVYGDGGEWRDGSEDDDMRR
eukprot:scaffold108964_cov33-Phaeocystis_antarctica.AAC.1